MTGSRAARTLLILPLALPLVLLAGCADGDDSASLPTAAATPAPPTAPPVPGTETLATLRSADGQTATSGLTATQNTIYVGLGCRGDGTVKIDVAGLASWTATCADTPTSLNSSQVEPGTAINVTVTAGSGIDWEVIVTEGAEEYTENGTPIVP